ncbi:MAG TPA: translocation/assembly module TamB domain-containing protein [Usitatibacter sp.]|nr:translocation/assembly module TamB domain-containing protein [Usitatibacter sp.]
MSDAAPAPPPRRRAVTRVALAALAALGVAALALAGALYWLGATDGGTRFAFAKLSAVLGPDARIEGVEGRLFERLRVASIEVDRSDLFVRADDVEVAGDPLVLLLHGRLDLRRLVARELEVRTASSGAAAGAPASLRPPFPVRLDDGRVGTLRYGALTPAEEAAADPSARRAARAAARGEELVLREVVLQADGGPSRWAIREASAASDYGRARVRGTLGMSSPFPIAMEGDYAGEVRHRPVRMTAGLRGTLKKLEARAEIDVPGSHASVRAQMEPFARHPVSSVRLDARGVDLARLQEGLPTTRLDVLATLASAAGGALEGPLRIDNSSAGPWDGGRAPVTRVAARVRVAADGRAAATGLRVELLGGGSVSGSVELAGGAVKADLAVAGVDLAALHGALRHTQLGGTLAVSGDRAAQRLAVALSDPRFEVEGSAALAAQRLQVESVTIRTGGGSLTGQGFVELAGSRDFRVEGRAEHFDPSSFANTPAGDLDVDFAAKGTLAGGGSGDARLQIASGRFAGLPASGHLRIAGDRSRIASADARVALGDARLDAHGAFGRPGDALDASLHVPDLAALSTALGMALSGRVEARGRLAGTFEDAALRLTVDASKLALPGGVRVRDATLRLQAGSSPASPVDATLVAHGLALGAAPAPIAEELRAVLQGTRAANSLRLDARASAKSALSAVLRGSLDPQAIAWNGRVESLELTGRGAFSLAAPATLAASPDRVELGEALLRGEWGEARLAATRWTPGTLEARGSSPGIRIRGLARSLELGEASRASLVLAGDWDIRAADTLDGRVDLRRLSGDLRVGDPALTLGLDALEMRADVSHGHARILVDIGGTRLGRIHGEASALVARGAGGWEIARDAPVAGRLVADVPDLAGFAGWLGPDARIAGRVAANLELSGTGGDPRVSGSVRAEDLALREPITGIELERGDVALRLDGKTLAIERLSAQAPWHPTPAAARALPDAARHAPGTIEGAGSVDLGSGQGEIRVRLAQVPVTQLPNRFVALSGEARLEATKQGLAVQGDFKADAGWVGAPESAPPSVPDDVVVVNGPAPAAAAKPEPIRIDLRFDFGDHLYFDGRGLDTRLAGSVRVTGEPPALRATGDVRTEGGVYSGYGQKLAIERGVLHFAGPLENPQLDVRAVRKGLPVEAGVEVSGSASRPRARLVSTPDVPDPEKLSWLVLGRAPSDLGATDISVVASVASAMLGKEPGEDIARRLGFDEVRIGRGSANSVLGALPQSTVAGRTGTASAAEVVTVGRSITRDVHLSFEQGVSDAEGSIKLAWQLGRKVQLLARAGYLPGLDVVWRWTFE